MAGRPTIAKIDDAQAGLWWWLAREAGPTLGWELAPSEKNPRPGKRYATSRKLVRLVDLSTGRLGAFPAEKQAKVRAVVESFLWFEELAGRISGARGLVRVRRPADAPPSYAGLARMRTASEKVTKHLRKVKADLFARKTTSDMKKVLAGFVGAGEEFYSRQIDRTASAESLARVDRMLAELRPPLLVAQRYRPHAQGFRLLDRRWTSGDHPDNWALAANDLLMRALGLIDVATAMLGPPIRAYPYTSEVSLNQDGWSRVLEDVTLVLHRAGFAPHRIEKLVEHGTKTGSKNRTVRTRLKHALEREELLDGEFVAENSSI